MRAIVLRKHGSPQEAFQIEERPDPRPGAGEVLIRVEVSGINFADIMARQGLYPEAPKPPSVLGYEAVGKIAALGSGVSSDLGLRIGTRVVAFTRFRGYAEQVLAPAIAVAKLPDALDSAEATALATQFCTAWYAAREMAPLFEGDRVLIHSAAGGVGNALVQLAKAKGCTIFGTASKNKLEDLRAAGVHHPIDSRDPHWASHVTGPVDVVFDAVGGKTARQGFKLLRSGGRMVSYGVASISGERWNPFRPLGGAAGFGFIHPLRLLMGSRGWIGVNMLRIADDRPEVLGRCMRAVVEEASQGHLKPKLDRVFSPERIGDAHARLASRQSRGKVAIRWP